MDRSGRRIDRLLRLIDFISLSHLYPGVYLVLVLMFIFIFILYVQAKRRPLALFSISASLCFFQPNFRLSRTSDDWHAISGALSPINALDGFTAIDRTSLRYST